MYSRTFNATVYLLWLGSMTWLVSQKVLPSLRIGQPPNYQTILEAQKHDPVVGWRLAFNDHELGWALSETKRQENGIMEIRSRIHFRELPLMELTMIISRMYRHFIDYYAQDFTLDTESSLLIDPLGKLLRFDSMLYTNALPEPICIRGVVEGTQMKVSFDFMDFSSSREIYLPQNAILGDAFSPQTQLPGLCEGQTWTVPTFSPFRPSRSPMEILIATVENRESISWNNQDVVAWLVVYRSDPGQSFIRNQTPRGKLWVEKDGRVLKQEAMLFDSTMTFTRMSDKEAQAIAREIKNEER
jgi:hypothetical protein